jgi:hypothetical protein
LIIQLIELFARGSCGFVDRLAGFARSLVCGPDALFDLVLQIEAFVQFLCLAPRRFPQLIEYAVVHLETSENFFVGCDDSLRRRGH